jgi:hypothetical protein
MFLPTVQSNFRSPTLKNAVGLIMETANSAAVGRAIQPSAQFLTLKAMLLVLNEL